MVVAIWIVTVLEMMTVMIMVMIRGGLKQIMPGDSKNLNHKKQLQCLHWYHTQEIVNCKTERITSSVSQDMSSGHRPVITYTDDSR
jgi:hypothetical protein